MSEVLKDNHPTDPDTATVVSAAPAMSWPPSGAHISDGGTEVINATRRPEISTAGHGWFNGTIPDVGLDVMEVRGCMLVTVAVPWAGSWRLARHWQ
jgi:hypothetical protein